jgi:hypothetical protein
MKKRQAASINRAGQPWDTPGHDGEDKPPVHLNVSAVCCNAQ